MERATGGCYRLRRGAGVGLLGAALVLAGCETERATAELIPGGDADRGGELMWTYGCGSCHTIPGVHDAHGQAGPPLAGWAGRDFIAGSLPNYPPNLIRWIMVPQAVEPGTAMPNLGVTEPEARDMAAYLYNLR